MLRKGPVCEFAYCPYSLSARVGSNLRLNLDKNAEGEERKQNESSKSKGEENEVSTNMSSKSLESDARLKRWLAKIPCHVKIQRVTKLCACCAGVALVATGGFKHHADRVWNYDLFAFCLCASAVACMYIHGFSIVVVSKGCKLLKSRNHADMPGAVGCLCEAFALENFTQSKRSINSLADSVCFALVKSLPHLQAKEWEELTPRQRSCLHNILYIGNRTQVEQLYGMRLAHAALSTLARVGDETSLSHVHNVAEQTDNPYLRQLALNSAASIQARIRHNEAAQVLLRPSASAATPDTLLRPAFGTPQPEAEAAKQLLRPT